MEVLYFGKCSINAASLVGMTKEDFTKAYTGKIMDINEAWKTAKKYTAEPKTDKPKPKRKKTDK